ncbi:MAG: 4Fe-4S binding protein [candidate division Zixibacteria bacterium]|nr:4Fe-4S binding protein [candidate division Zixibacteria bacterium]
MVTLRYLPNVTTLNLAPETCSGCKFCVMVCPQAVFAVENKKAKIIDRDACMECGACAQNCPESSITVRSGVGCAYGVLLGKLKNTEPTCGCDVNSSSCC